MARTEGHRWEDRARRFLNERGLRILLSRYQSRFGELDLVCLETDCLVIVEVRARATGSVVSALESIGTIKQNRMVLATKQLIVEHPGWIELPIRFDVVAIDGIDGPRPRVTWIRNAFSVD